MENKPPVKNMKMNTNNRTAAGWTVAILGAGFLMYKVRRKNSLTPARIPRKIWPFEWWNEKCGSKPFKPIFDGETSFDRCLVAACFLDLNTDVIICFLEDQMRKQAEEARQKVRDQPSTEPSETIPRAMKEQYRDTKGALKETGQEVKGKAQNVKNEVDIQADKDRLREEINKLQDRLDKNR